MLYIAEWEKNKKNSWSGTTYSLLEAIRKKTEIKEIQLQTASKKQRIIYILVSFLKYLRIEKSMVFNTYFQEKNNKVIKEQINHMDNESDVLQIGDIAEIKNSYIYQDLSISFLIHCRDNDRDSFYYSGFEQFTREDLNRRNEIQKRRYEEAKFIFTMSKHLRDFLIHHDGFDETKVIHVGGGINLPALSENNLIKNRKRLLFVGRDFTRKGGELVVEAFKILKKTKFSDLELYIAGPEKIEAELDEGIFFLGNLSTEKLSYYFRLCDIFCMPSKFEAYGLVFIEALSYGLPCIGVNKFEMVNFIKDGYNGYLINDMNSYKELSDKIEMLLKNDAIFENVAREREYYREEYSWDKVAERIISVIND